MSDTFDAEKFLSWLEERDGPIRVAPIEDKFPHFPWKYASGVTCTFVNEDGEILHDLESHDGEIYLGYYKSDLRRAAKRKMPID